MTLVGKERTLMSVRLAVTLAAVLLALPAAGQESSSPPAYLFQLETSITPAEAAVWADAMTLAAKAHAKHPEGNMFATYRKLTGGPNETVRTFFALNQLGDLDDWQSNRQIVTEALGKDRARIVLSDLDASENTAESILSYSGKLSSPDVGFRATKFAWVIEVEVEEGKMTEYAALAKRLAQTSRGQETGKWLVYGNAIGGSNSVLHYYYGFDQFAELDSWTSRLEALSESLGDFDAARLLAAMEAVSKTTSSLWQLEPELSQLQPK